MHTFFHLSCTLRTLNTFFFNMQSTTSTASTVIAGTALFDDDDTANMLMELSDTAASQPSPPPAASPNIRTADARRSVEARVKNLFRFCNLDKRLRVTLKAGVRKGLGIRAKVPVTLRFLFGDAFAEGAFFYKHPDWFISHLLHLASAGGVQPDADLGQLFVRSGGPGRTGGGLYHVDEAVLEALGCTKKQLSATLKKVPGQSEGSLDKPLVVPVTIAW